LEHRTTGFPPEACGNDEHEAVIPECFCRGSSSLECWSIERLDSRQEHAGMTVGEHAGMTCYRGAGFKVRVHFRAGKDVWQ
jgi:hypothetical protein